MVNSSHKYSKNKNIIWSTEVIGTICYLQLIYYLSVCLPAENISVFVIFNQHAVHLLTEECPYQYFEITHFFHRKLLGNSQVELAYPYEDMFSMQNKKKDLILFLNVACLKQINILDGFFSILKESNKQIG